MVTTRFVTRGQHEDMFLVVVEILLSTAETPPSEQGSSLATTSAVSCCLHWKDAIALVAVNRSFRAEFMDRQNTLLLPLLSYLEESTGTNIHEYCGKAYAPLSQRKCTCAMNADLESYNHPEYLEHVGPVLDPRYKANYDGLSITQKCGSMVRFLTLAVQNLRDQFDFTDMANPDNMPEPIGDPYGWCLGWGYEMQEEWKNIFLNRAAFAFNLTLLGYAAGELCDQPYYCRQAILGEGPIENTGTSFNLGFAECILDLVPFEDERLIESVQRLLPKRSILNLLGPALVDKVVLCSPLFDNNIVCRDTMEVILPDSLEVFTNDDLVQFGFQVNEQ